MHSMHEARSGRRREPKAARSALGAGQCVGARMMKSLGVTSD